MSAWRAKLEVLPKGPGVYVFKDAAGAYLYVGKAASLRSRVRSYFHASTTDQRYFIDRLERELADIETFVTATEKEAALLENGLIKQQQPRYNVKLRDDKDYLSLRLDPASAWPRLEVVRRPKQDGARYFGPYHSASSARATLRLVNRHFQLRTCTDGELARRTRACLQYQIKRCPAPCVREVDRASYGEQVHDVGLFLEGRHDELVRRLDDAMSDASAAMRYELAATYRDQLRALRSVHQPQRVSLVRDLDQDVFGFFRSEDKAELAVLMLRRGRVAAVRTFGLRDVRVPDDELIGAFVAEYYGLASFLPDEVLVPVQIEAVAGVAQWLSEAREKRLAILRPQRGSKARLVRMAMENAVHAFREKARATEDARARAALLAERIGAPRPIERFECIDVSHSAGTDTVAVIVAFRDGEPERKRYRSFHLRGVSGGDDYAAMREVLRRRFRRGKARERGWELPDLLVVDGGRGQLAVALAVLAELGVIDVPVVGLAKEKENLRGERLVDRLYVSGRKNPIELRSAGRAFAMLAQARDEAHRASNELRRRKTKARSLHSELADVPGVGDKTRARLLRSAGSVAALRGASEADLVAMGATRAQARSIAARLASQPLGEAPGEEHAVDNAFAAVTVLNGSGG